MLLIECMGLKGRPCGEVLGYSIGKNKENSVSHGLCRSCYLEMQMENGVATPEEKRELHEIMQHHKRVALRGYRREERRNGRA